MSSQADAGLKAFNDGNYEEAIKFYTQALASSKSPLWLIQRSTAYHRTKQYDLALADAEAALLSAIDRGRREQIATAQFRRAIALYKLDRFGDARMALKWARDKNEKEKGMSTWIAMIFRDYEACDEDDPRRKISVLPVPSRDSERTLSDMAADAVPDSPEPAPKVFVSATTPLEKIRRDWYQSSSTVTITILAKGIPKDAVQVKFGTQTLNVVFPVGSGDHYDLSIAPLFGQIDAAGSTYTVTPSKLEISLKKAVPNTKWSTLDGIYKPEEIDSLGITTNEKNTPEKAPSYPTSSKNGPKNWDAMKSFVLTDDSGKTEKVEVKDDELEDGDELNGFFKKLYKDADPDTRRAMLKSYQESNGTSLSTNWADVGSKSFKPEDENEK